MILPPLPYAPSGRHGRTKQGDDGIAVAIASIFRRIRLIKKLETHDDSLRKVLDVLATHAIRVVSMMKKVLGRSAAMFSCCRYGVQVRQGGLLASVDSVGLKMMSSIPRIAPLRAILFSIWAY